MVSQQQVFFLLTTSCYVAAVFMLWTSWLLKPFKLWTTLMHEFSHALAAWLVCGEVTGIEVHQNEGGLTHWKTSPEKMRWARYIVLPAGYLGSALWSFCIIISCGNLFWARVMALALIVVLLICLIYAIFGQTEEQRGPLIGLSIGFGSILCLLVVLSFLNSSTSHNVWDVLLVASLLFVGVLNALYATLDVYYDTVSRTNERSDAYQFSQICPCCFPKCVGLVWFLLASIILILAGYVYMQMQANAKDDVSWMMYLPGPVAVAFAFAVRGYDCIGKRTYSPIGIAESQA
ncbi:hypothetical protein AB1Y20_023155 [Prymnesium parvum]|uniref:Peptidase M50B-like-domain-containing protein n=1 Tax=Prymnesium parvum TaxID=97485 RepID=A0AB34JD25_PRYPA